MEVFIWIEESFLSTWVREATWAFPTLLVLHALGMAFLVGTSLAINCRLLGLASQMAIQGFIKFYPVMTLAFIVNLVSGLLLLLSYPAKALTNPVFFLKMALVIVAVTLTQKQKSFIASTPSQSTVAVSTTNKRIAALILFLWAAGIISGRFLAYTHTWLLVS